MKSCAISTVLFSTVALFAVSVNGYIQLGTNVYFTDASIILRNHDQARSYCISQGAELAKVTNYTLYQSIRLSFSESTYWIDGADKQNQDRFALDNRCTSDKLDYNNFPKNYLDIPAKSCLALVNGNSVASSKIAAMDCIIPQQVLCAFPLLQGCP